MSDGEGGAPLVLVSNRGPVTYQDDGSVKRGTGGLATALIGLASHRDAVWIASAMTDGDVEMAREHGGEAFEIEAPDGGEFRVRFVDSDPEAYDRFYNIFANPMLWFIQHYLWDQSNAPDIRRHEVEAFEYGYNVVNAAFPVIRSDGTVLWEDGMDSTVKVATPAEMCQAKAAGLTILGYFLGEISFVEQNIEAMLILIVLLSVVPIIIEIIKARREKKKLPEASADAATEIIERIT